MSKKNKKQFTKRLFRNGQRGHHNTLLREFHGCSSIELVKDSRNLLEKRDYRSDRYKKARLIAGKKRRAYMKRLTNEIISDEI